MKPDMVSKTLAELLYNLSKKGVLFLCTKNQEIEPQVAKLLRTPNVLTLHYILIEELVKHKYALIDEENEGKRLILRATRLFDSWYTSN